MAMTPSATTHLSALPPGAELNGYVITGLIGQGGFGVVYVARDNASNRTVAIKEFLPSAIAGRRSGGQVAARTPELANTYAIGLKGFLREANLLSELAHPALVAVHRAWEQNGTAYMAMAYYPGKTLRELRLASPELATLAMTEAHIKALMMPVFDAVAELHAHRVIHRDVSPDNILVMANGATVLLDLGAARQVLGGMTQALTTILKPGFAPIEQYVEDGSMEQGRWTDVYGLGAVMYFLATGRPPTPATTRIVRDNLPAMATAAVGAVYSPGFIYAVNKALSVRAIGRYKSITEFRDALGWTQKIALPQVAPITEQTAAVAALTAEQIRHLTEPRAELAATPPDAPGAASVTAPARPPQPTQTQPPLQTQQRGPQSLERLRGRGKDYQPDQRSSVILPIAFVLTLALIAAFFIFRR